MLYIISIIGFILKTFSNVANFTPTIFIYLNELLVEKNTKMLASYSFRFWTKLRVAMEREKKQDY
jgi:hypothetical protein